MFISPSPPGPCELLENENRMFSLEDLRDTVPVGPYFHRLSASEARLGSSTLGATVKREAHTSESLAQKTVKPFLWKWALKLPELASAAAVGKLIK